MRPYGLLVAMLPSLLAGCGGGYVGQNEPPAPPTCEHAADEDPTVKDIMAKMAGTAYWRTSGQNDLIVARRDALLRCMRQKGLISKGGVEVVRPLWYDWP